MNDTAQDRRQNGDYAATNAQRAPLTEAEDRLAQLNARASQLTDRLRANNERIFGAVPEDANKTSLMETRPGQLGAVFDRIIQLERLMGMLEHEGVRASEL